MAFADLPEPREAPAALDSVRYEVLPFASAETEAAALAHPVTLTVTCSPRHGMDQALDVAARLRGLGHLVVLHLAARMVTGEAHLGALLDRMAEAGIADVFLVGGDAPEPLGPYDSALDLLARLRDHPKAPRTIGVGAYPEGHPLIDAGTLAAALRDKAGDADYMVTQLCFDPEALVRWLRATRADGVDLPVYVGVPGLVDRRRLIDVSMRVGVGASLRYLRKQRGIRRLMDRPSDAPRQLLDAAEPLIGGDLGVAGVHFFTFNRLVGTVAFGEGRLGADVTASA